MKKFIFELFHSDESIRMEIYSDSYTEAKTNVFVATNCPENKILFVEETETFNPIETWDFKNS